MPETSCETPAFGRATPPGDDRERDVCTRCGFVDYKNPKIVVGAVLVHAERILLCRRAIEPSYGRWTIPAGYLEVAESVEDGARREAYEEARVRPTLEQVLAVYSVPRISQVQIIYRGRLETAAAAPGPESLETAFFAWKDIPWPEIAFPSVAWALRHYRESAAFDVFAPYGNPIEGL